MAALGTTITVLGAVALFEPVNGYQVRRELSSWELDQWAQIKPGSIYSMLTTLTREGYVVRHDLSDDGRPVAVYTTTEAGRDRLRQLLAQGLVEVDPLSPLSFHISLLLAGLLPRTEVARCLTQRIANLWTADADLKAKLAVLGTGAASPPHVTDVVQLSHDLVRAEAAWLERYLARIEAGEFDFAGERATWTPPAGDEGWQMETDRARYRTLLARGARD